MMEEWFYSVGGKRTGPITKADLQKLFNEGSISDGTLVWNNDAGSNWRAFAEFAQLKPQANSEPPPLPSSAINDKWAWAMALTPVPLAFLDVWLRETTGSGLDFGSYCMLSLIIYLTCITFDGRLVAAAGSGNRIRGATPWLLLSPVAYLFVRSRRLGKTFMPSFVWIASMLLPILLTSHYFASSAYLGSGTPACGANSSIAKIKEIFPKLPINFAAMEALDIEDINDAGLTDDKRTCNAKVRASDGNAYGIVYTIEAREEGYYYYLRVSG